MPPVDPPAGLHRTPPDRLRVGDEVIANDKAPLAYRDRRGHITEISSDGAECRVEFDDDLRPTTGYLKAKWLQR